jgi:two-component system, response regulator
MQHGPLRLLYLEDDDNDAFLLKRALTRLGHPAMLTRLRDGAEGIEFMESITAVETQAPHLIMSDLKMPRVDGIQFAHWLRQSRYSCLPLLIFTASSLAEDVLACYRSGAHSFATKPLNAHQLEHTIGTVVHYWDDVCRVQNHSHLLHCGGG